MCVYVCVWVGVCISTYVCVCVLPLQHTIPAKRPRIHPGLKGGYERARGGVCARVNLQSSPKNPGRHLSGPPRWLLQGPKALGIRSWIPNLQQRFIRRIWSPDSPRANLGVRHSAREGRGASRSSSVRRPCKLLSPFGDEYSWISMYFDWGSCTFTSRHNSS